VVDWNDLNFSSFFHRSVFCAASCNYAVPFFVNKSVSSIKERLTLASQVQAALKNNAPLRILSFYLSEHLLAAPAVNTAFSLVVVLFCNRCAAKKGGKKKKKKKKGKGLFR
jgi:hypothetical protein